MQPPSQKSPGSENAAPVPEHSLRVKGTAALVNRYYQEVPEILEEGLPFSFVEDEALLSPPTVIEFMSQDIPEPSKGQSSLLFGCFCVASRAGPQCIGVNQRIEGGPSGYRQEGLGTLHLYPHHITHVAVHPESSPRTHLTPLDLRSQKALSSPDHISNKENLQSLRVSSEEKPLVTHIQCAACKLNFLFKFLVIGNAGTGKSCLLHQFIEKKFKDDSNHTIGVEFGSKIINVGGKYVKLQIWDTAGQERFRSVTRSYYRGAAGALLVYDSTSRETYNALTNWLTDARMLASQNIVIILCGNKKDLDTDREVTFLEASRFAQENGKWPLTCHSYWRFKMKLYLGKLMFLETSALTGENVEEAFVQCARKILNKIESGELDPERMGSGIQYGDAALRQLRSPRRAQAPSAQECGC
ncbi:hypothetical protein E5288_WYG008727 [Bos mutus]|uniref:Ras-related protein Rab-4 n=1 Tax=Bos mutus TaxID=72004 RepID=A0A6B0S4W3_9CETA|nr:hypothetical protein [Bos mutus]